MIDLRSLTGDALAGIYSRVTGVDIPPFADQQFGARRVENALEQHGKGLVIERGQIEVVDRPAALIDGNPAPNK